jgi:Ca-activated chloride channel family protein
MFCTKCGAKVLPEDRFCISCGQSLEEENVELHKAEGVTELRSAKANFKWVIISIAALIILGGAGYWFLSGSEDNQELVQASTNATNSNSTQVTEEQPELLENEDEVATETTAVTTIVDPVYIKVNQVDSAKYEQGEVDVYFSLFTDQAYQNELGSMQLTKEMFKVNDLPIKFISQVENVDTVSVNLVIDKSGSMSEPPSGADSHSKLDLVRQAAVEFLRNVPTTAKGQFEVLSFSTYAPTVADISFTKDRSSVSSFLEGLQSDGGETALYDSLTKALYDTNMQNGPKYIIAFTDGQDSNYGSSVQSVIELSRQLGIPIYCIGFGEMAKDLQLISEETGGQYFAISTDDDLQQELQQIYDKVFQRYVKQYKISYTPNQKVSPGNDFTLTMGMETAEQKAQTEALTFTRKMDVASINVLNGLFEYQVNYANAVNNLDFKLVGDNVKSDTPFFENLKNRIEVDYVKASNNGKPKVIDPLENFRVESVSPQEDGSFKIVFFKFFPLLQNNENMFEADLNTYTLVQDKTSNKWQISEFGRKECSIYRDQSDLGSLCTENAVDTLYSGDPWREN